MTAIAATPVAHRVSVRFLATLVANLVRSALAFVTGLLIARALGAAEYGNLSFLLGSFTAFTFLLDAGTTPAFYTFVSARKRSPKFFALYLAWTLGVQFVLTMTVIAWLLPDFTVRKVWLDQPRTLILLACAANFLMTQLWISVGQLGEASRKTVIVQAASVAQALAHLALVVLFWQLGSLTIATVFTLLIVEFALLALIAGPILIRPNIDHDDRTSTRVIMKMFAAYCGPLIVYGVVNSIYSFAYRWLLQRYGGAVEQGYFSVGQQLNAIAMIATSSILNVLWKEVAEARERGDESRVQMLYATTRRAVYAFAALVCCFLVPFSREVLAVSVGRDYLAGWLTAAVLFLLPIHQAIGQIVTTFLYAVSETRTYTAYGLASMVVSIPATYFALAPRDAIVPGLELGSLGLAVAMVVIQIIGVSALSMLIARRRGWKNDLGFQLAMLGLLIAIGFAAEFIARFVTTAPLAKLVAGAAAYGLLALPIAAFLPQLAGERTMLVNVIRRRRS